MMVCTTEAERGKERKMDREELMKIAAETLAGLTQEDRNDLWEWMLMRQLRKAEIQKQNEGNRNLA